MDCAPSRFLDELPPDDLEWEGRADREDPERKQERGKSAIAGLRSLLAVVADGMGGHASGEIASAIAVEAVQSVLLGEVNPDETRLDRASMDQEEEIIAACLGVYSSPKNEFTVRYVSSTRDVTDSQEYMLIYIDFITLHTINRS